MSFILKPCCKICGITSMDFLDEVERMALNFQHVTISNDNKVWICNNCEDEESKRKCLLFTEAVHNLDMLESPQEENVAYTGKLSEDQQNVNSTEVTEVPEQQPYPEASDALIERLTAPLKNWTPFYTPSTVPLFAYTPPNAPPNKTQHHNNQTCFGHF